MRGSPPIRKLTGTHTPRDLSRGARQDGLTIVETLAASSAAAPKATLRFRCCVRPALATAAFALWVSRRQTDPDSCTRFPLSRARSTGSEMGFRMLWLWALQSKLLGRSVPGGICPLPGPEPGSYLSERADGRARCAFATSTNWMRAGTGVAASATAAGPVYSGSTGGPVNSPIVRQFVPRP
jgi:hypothetical protein